MSTATASPPASLNSESVRRYVTTLFEPNDYVTLRPVEVWVDGKGKQRRVLHEMTISVPSKAIAEILEKWYPAIGEQRGNVFLGVCPRQCRPGEFELAWQIATVRTLWSDVDGCSVADAMQCIEAAGLPHPTGYLTAAMELWI